MRKSLLSWTLALGLAWSVWAESEPRRLLLPLPHNAEIQAMQFSRSGQKLASGDRNGLIKVWNWPRKTVELTLQPLRGDEAAIAWLGFSGEELLVARRSDGEFRLYDLSEGREIAKISGEQRSCPTMLGNRLAVVRSADDAAPVVEVLTLPEGKVQRTLPIPGVEQPQTYWVKALAGSPDARRLALALDPVGEGSDRLLELDADTAIRLRAGDITNGYAPESLVYSPNGQRLAGYGWDIVVWSGEQVRVHKPERSGLKGLQWSSDQQLTYAISNDGATLHQWNIEAEKPVQVRNVAEGGMTAPIVVSPEGTPVFTTHAGGLVNGQTDALLGQAAAVSPVSSVHFHPSGRLITGLEDGDALVWDLRAGKYERRFSLPGCIRGIASSADGQKLALTTNHDNTLRIYDWKTGKLLTSIATECVQGAGYVLQFSPNGEVVAVLQSKPPGWQQELMFYRVRDGQQMWRKETNAHFAFHPRENKFAVLRKEGVAEVDLTTGDEVFHKLRNLRDCAYDAKGELYVLTRSGPDARLLKLYPKHTGRLDEGAEVAYWRRGMDKLQYEPRTRTWWLHEDSGALFHVDETGKELGRLPEAVSYTYPNSWQVLPNDLLAIRGREGGVEFWRAGQTLPEGQLVMLQGGKNWLVTSSNGLFDGTDEAERLIEWMVGKQRYRVDQFFGQGYRPGLLREFYRGIKVSKAVGPLTRLQHPPKLEILSPAPGTLIEGRETEVRVRLIDQGAGYSRPKIYVNGHGVGASHTRSEGANVYVFKTRLAPGVNEIRATGFDGSGLVESRGDRLRVTCVASGRREPRLFVLAVGVNRASAGRPLQFAEDDARAFAERLKSDLYRESQIQIVTGPGATKVELDKRLREIEARAEPQDTLVVFFAGHGVAQADGYRFLLAGQNAEVDSLSSTELAAYLETIEAHRQFVVLDTCHSAAASPDLAARFAISQQRMARGSGTFLLAACRSDETAAELPTLKHGLLTYTLLTALGKRGAPLNSQGQLTVNGLIQYVSQQFPEVTRRHSQAQELYQFSNGTDFPLTGRSRVSLNRAALPTTATGGLTHKKARP